MPIIEESLLPHSCSDGTVEISITSDDDLLVKLIFMGGRTVFPFQWRKNWIRYCPGCGLNLERQM